jgi:hypothetical protein
MRTPSCSHRLTELKRLDNHEKCQQSRSLRFNRGEQKEENVGQN